MREKTKIDEQMASRLIKEFPLEAARLLERLPAGGACSLLAEVADEAVSEVIKLMERKTAAACLLSWPVERTETLIALLGPALVSLLVRALNQEERRTIFSRCNKRIADPIRRRLRYPEESAGALMDPNAAAAYTDMSAPEIIKLLQKSASSVSSYIYVTDRHEILKGVMGIRDLFAASSKTPAAQIMRSPAVSIPAQADRSSILSHPGWKRHHALPVTGHGGTLIGVISHRIFRELQNRNVLLEGQVPLLLTIAQMYWNVMMRLTESLTGFPGNSGKQKGKP